MNERDIFIAALERHSETERTAYLDEACGCVGQLRESVEALLREHAQLGDFLECPAPVVWADGLDGGDDIHRSLDTGALEARVLGDFRIIREVGRGGMGNVYEVDQISLGRRMALKVLPFAAILDPRQLQRFQNEARAAASLKHPHIVSVHSVGCERGVHYYAMEYVEGKTLAQLIDELRSAARPNSVVDQAARSSHAHECAPAGHAAQPVVAGGGAQLADEKRPDAQVANTTTSTTHSHTPEFFQMAARLGIQAAEALDHAHLTGVIHRDIKPSNLLVDDQGNLFITDFGLAITQHDPALTHTGDLLGTLRYMSPEQARGDRHVVDQRTDIYSLGITLYELLTCRPAFDGANREVILRQIAEEDPPAPRRVLAAIPKDLETIVLKAIDKDPAQRYATAQQMADDLKRFLEHEPIEARRPSWTEHVAKWTRRHRPLVTTVVVAGLVILAVSVASALLVFRAYEREKTEHGIAEQNALEAEKNYEIARDAIRQMLTRLDDEQSTQSPELQAIRRHLLEDTAAFCTAVIQRSRRDPGADIHQLLADRYLDLKEYENTIAEATRCIELAGGTPEEAADPRNFDKYVTRAEAYAGLSRYQESLADWDRVMELVADRPWYYKRRALVHFQLQNYDQALADLTKAVELYPTDYSTLTWISPDLVADCPDEQFRVGLLALADKAVILSGNSPVVYWNRNNLYRVVDPDRSRADLDVTVAREPGNIAAWLDRGTLATEQQRWTDAIASFEQVLAIMPDNPRACNSLAWLLCNAGDRSLWNIGRSLELAQKATTLNPTGHSAWNTLGAAQYRAGNYEAAIAALNKAMSIGSRIVSTDYIVMAMVQWQLGNQEEALRWYHMSDAPPHSTSFPALRREAAELLGIAEQYPKTEKQPEGTNK